jgi:hypothetical protein
MFTDVPEVLAASIFRTMSTRSIRQLSSPNHHFMKILQEILNFYKQTDRLKDMAKIIGTFFET